MTPPIVGKKRMHEKWYGTRSLERDADLYRSWAVLAAYHGSGTKYTRSVPPPCHVETTGLGTQQKDAAMHTQVQVISGRFTWARAAGVHRVTSSPAPPQPDRPTDKNHPYRFQLP